MESNKAIKRWKKIKTFNTFQEADALRNKIITEDETNSILVRVRRYGHGGEQFMVKTHHPDSQNQKKQKKKGDKK
tara:strand:+ start:82 stop:306 length:225 start_codon:yes stop_codon:yes gene_type:complete